MSKPVDAMLIKAGSVVTFVVTHQELGGEPEERRFQAIARRDVLVSGAMRLSIGTGPNDDFRRLPAVLNEP